MFKCNEFIYIQMQKTACTHIANLLSQLFDGEMIGKHNVATKEQLESTPYFIASIRNPWDWYLSLWTFGLQSRGALMHRLTNRDLPQLFKMTLKNPLRHCKDYIHELTKSVQQWRDVYTTASDDIIAFRRWLALIHHPDNYRTLGEGYADTKLIGVCGLMTYRYLYLCCRQQELLRKKTSCPQNLAELLKFDTEHCYIHSFVRHEALAETLCSALTHIRTLLASERLLIFNATKTNTSLRLLNIDDYYDQASIDLIRHREQLIIEKFNYSPPN